VRGTTLEEICSRANVSPRTFFNHFANREELYASIGGRGSGELVTLIEALTADERPLDVRLPRMFRAIGRGMAATPAYRELVGEMLYVRPTNGSPMARTGRVGQAMQRFVRDAARRGEIAKRHRVEVIADVASGTILVAITNWCTDSTFDLERELGRAAHELVSLFRTA